MGTTLSSPNWSIQGIFEKCLSNNSICFLLIEAILVLNNGADETLAKLEFQLSLPEKDAVISLTLRLRSIRNPGFPS